MARDLPSEIGAPIAEPQPLDTILDSAKLILERSSTIEEILARLVPATIRDIGGMVPGVPLPNDWMLPRHNHPVPFEVPARRLLHLHCPGCSRVMC